MAVYEAQDLPDTDTAFFNIDGDDFTDAYVTGTIYKTIFYPAYLQILTGMPEY